MKNTFLFSLFFFTASSLAAGEDSFFKKYFRDATLRIDYHHAGSKGEERYSFDRLFEEGAWSGSAVNLIDTLNLGEYIVKIVDVSSQQLLYSRGYSTMFNEWQTTDEAIAGVWKIFHESARIPYPLKKFQFVVARRNKNSVFQELFSALVDPNGIDIHREKHRESAEVKPVISSGDPKKKVDIAVLGDGYANDEMKKFRDDVKHFTEALFATQPFKGRKNDFNVWAVEVLSPESGIDQPEKNIWVTNPLGTTYNTFGSARYVLTEDNTSLRNYASLAPYDFLFILLNTKRYGGGGIFQLYSTCYTVGETPESAWQAEYVFVHEFGHSFGGLGDEYYSSSTAYNDFYPKGVEPWEPNVAQNIFKGALKWTDMVKEETPIPTPWEKGPYDSLESLRGKLLRDDPNYNEKREGLLKHARQILLLQKDGKKVGAFEGAGYSSTGLFRPSVDCRMFSLSLVDFDPVCSRAIERMIDFYSK